MKTRLCLTALMMLVVMTAATAAPKAAPPTLQSQITAQLGHPDAWVQARACYLFGEFGMTSSTPVLTKVVNDTHRSNLVRLHAGVALGRLGSPMGLAICRDMTNNGAWAKTAKAEVAQHAFLVVVATRLLGTNTDVHSKPTSQVLDKAIEALQNGAVKYRDSGGNCFAADQKLVLLDRHDREAWVWLAQDFTDIHDTTRAAAVRAIADKFKATASATLSGTKVGVFARGRERARQT